LKVNQDLFFGSAVGAIDKAGKIARKILTDRFNWIIFFPLN
jgi:hypothetical protein